MLKKLCLCFVFAGVLIYGGLLNSVFTNPVGAEEKENKEDSGHLIQLTTEEEEKEEKGGHLIQLVSDDEDEEGKGGHLIQ